MIHASDDEVVLVPVWLDRDNAAGMPWDRPLAVFGPVPESTGPLSPPPLSPGEGS